jgi:protein gp37
MSATTAIEWTESTWNPLTGCTKISPGCQHCYAERMAKRLQAMRQPNYAFRIDHLRATHAQVKFLSLEPLLGPLPALDLAGIDWVILGGESGPGARSLDVAWVTEVRDQCAAAGVPFFFKQWGGVRKKRAGRTLEGRTWDGMPVSVTGAISL